MEITVVGTMSRRAHPGWRQSPDAGVTKVCSSTFPRVVLELIAVRYLIDTDQEVEGLSVIADFQGGQLDDPLVLAEYKEIRDAVLIDVGVLMGLGAR